MPLSVKDRDLLWNRSWLSTYSSHLHAVSVVSMTTCKDQPGAATAASQSFAMCIAATSLLDGPPTRTLLCGAPLDREWTWRLLPIAQAIHAIPPLAGPLRLNLRE